jgi:hypothetical protein
MNKKAPTTKPPATEPDPPTGPPPDDPLHRHQQEEQLDDRAMAQKRQQAIKQLRQPIEPTGNPDK